MFTAGRNHPSLPVASAAWSRSVHPHGPLWRPFQEWLLGYPNPGHRSLSPSNILYCPAARGRPSDWFSSWPPPLAAAASRRRQRWPSPPLAAAAIRRRWPPGLGYSSSSFQSAWSTFATEWLLWRTGSFRHPVLAAVSARSKLYCTQSTIYW